MARCFCCHSRYMHRAMVNTVHIRAENCPSTDLAWDKIEKGRAVTAE